MKTKPPIDAETYLTSHCDYRKQMAVIIIAKTFNIMNGKNNGQDNV